MELWHNPRCSKSRAARAILDGRGVAHPILIARPILVDGGRAVLGRSPEAIEVLP